MTAGAGSALGPGLRRPACCASNPASGAIHRAPSRFRGLGADVAYGDGFIWVITEESRPTAAAGQEYLYKIGPVPRRDREGGPDPPAAGKRACAASPGPRGIWDRLCPPAEPQSP